MPERSHTIEQILDMLAAAPPRIAALTTDLVPAQLRASPRPDEWSVNDILAHLRACADMWGGCIAKMLREDTSTRRAVNPRKWIKQKDYPDLEFHLSLQSYADQRAELLTDLEPLPPEAWLRAATVTGAGAPLRRTVQFYAQWLTRHERTHMKQIERVVKLMRR